LRRFWRCKELTYIFKQYLVLNGKVLFKLLLNFAANFQ